VFLPNYSSGNIKTNSIQPVSACLAFFEAIWQFFASGLTFFVHLDLATLFSTRAGRAKAIYNQLLTGNISYSTLLMLLGGALTVRGSVQKHILSEPSSPKQSQTSCCY